MTTQRTLFCSVPVELSWENGRWVARNQDLGLAVSGNTKEEARERFGEALQNLQTSHPSFKSFREYLDRAKISAVLPENPEEYDVQETWVFGCSVQEEAKAA